MSNIANILNFQASHATVCRQLIYRLQVLGEKTTFPPLWLIRACHRRGWAYATASYRLLPEASGLDILSDALDAVRWIHDHISKNIIIAGSSAGGYLALATAANPHAPRPLAVLSIYGMLDLASQRYVQPALEFSGFTVSDITASAEEITKAKTAGQVLDGYPFPENRQEDKRYNWIARCTSWSCFRIF